MNDGDQAVHFLYLIGLLVLVGSAFMVRRIPIAQGLKMFVAWVLIFGILPGPLMALCAIAIATL